MRREGPAAITPAPRRRAAGARLPTVPNMPKLKTKSSAKKRFRLTASGKVRGFQTGKRHGMIKRTPKFIRNQRGSALLAEPDARVVRKHYLPNG